MAPAAPTAPSTTPALLVQGAGGDAENEPMLNLSGINQQYLCFAGYCRGLSLFRGRRHCGKRSFPNPWTRGLATVNAFGIYSLAYTNCGLYSGGNHTICSMVTLDGTNFWTTGQAGSGTVKFVNSTRRHLRQWLRRSQLLGGQRRRRAQHSDRQRTAPGGFSSVSNLVCPMRARVSTTAFMRLVARRSRPPPPLPSRRCFIRAGGCRLILPSVRITRRFTSPRPGC